MYLLNTLLDEYRLPYMEKQQICEESVSIKNTEKLYEILNQYFKLGKRSEEYVYMAALDSRLRKWRNADMYIFRKKVFY